MALPCCKTIFRLELCIKINTKPTMHKVISALLSSGSNSESLLEPSNSETMKLGLRSGSIYIASILMVPRSLGSDLLIPTNRTQETADLTQGRAVLSAAAGDVP